MPIKVISLDFLTNLGLVECWCGGRMFIPMTGATEDTPVRARCPNCRNSFDHPTDLEK